MYVFQLSNKKCFLRYNSISVYKPAIVGFNGDY